MPSVHYHLGKFPPAGIDFNALSPITGQALLSLGRYDGLLHAIPDAMVLLSPLKMQEAVLSSKIEGTRVTMAEALEIQSGINADKVEQSKRDDTEEVINYRRTLTDCTEEIQNRPISLHMIRSAHASLMNGVRGKDKSPGTVRSTQNWIGSQGCAIESAGFVPVAPEHLIAGLEEWEKYVVGKQDIDPISKLAIIHVEFEALHPFLDGNGRLGRMLIPLFLFQEKILNSPCFYMSSYIEKNRDEYQEKMRAVSRDNAWEAWIKFFATGVKLQAEENISKAKEILGLYNTMKQSIQKTTHSQYAVFALDFIFEWLVFTTADFCAYSRIPGASARSLLGKLEKNKIIQVISRGSGRRPTLYVFRRLMEIVESGLAVNA